PAAARMLGCEAGDLVGRDMHAAVHHTRPDGSHYPHRDCPIYAAFRDGIVHQVDHEVFWRADGTSFPVEYTSTPIRDRGRLLGAVIVFRDISQRREA
ncbi:PAS domain-containing protein, partial [Escherichia coli]|nr:PAS domain-containing protein [Escherichia coli]